MEISIFGVGHRSTDGHDCHEAMGVGDNHDVDGSVELWHLVVYLFDGGGLQSSLGCHDVCVLWSEYHHGLLLVVCHLIASILGRMRDIEKRVQFIALLR